MGRGRGERVVVLMIDGCGGVLRGGPVIMSCGSQRKKSSIRGAEMLF